MAIKRINIKEDLENNRIFFELINTEGIKKTISDVKKYICDEKALNTTIFTKNGHQYNFKLDYDYAIACYLNELDLDYT